MQRDTRLILNDSELIEIRDKHLRRLQALYNGDELDSVFILRGVMAFTIQHLHDSEKWLSQSLDWLAEKSSLSKDLKIFQPLSINFDPWGVHFIDKIFDADVFDLNESWQVHPFTKPVGELFIPDLDRSEPWQLNRQFAEKYLNSEVRLPLFGQPTLSSVLNIGVNLYGQELLVAMITDPSAVHHDFRIINDVICRLHEWYLQNMPADQRQCILPDSRCQPPGYGQLCGCTSQLISEELYREFVAPYDEKNLSTYPNGGMIHLCGSHTHLIPVWREMKSLRAIQINDQAAEDLEIYFNELRNDQVIYVLPCPGMTVERIMKITKGNRIVITPGWDFEYDDRLFLR